MVPIAEEGEPVYGTLDFVPAQLDVDMFFAPIGMDELALLSTFWASTAGSTMKVFSGRPNHLQLFSQPVGVFVEVPPSEAGTAVEACRGLKCPCPLHPPIKVIGMPPLWPKEP